MFFGSNAQGHILVQLVLCCAGTKALNGCSELCVISLSRTKVGLLLIYIAQFKLVQDKPQCVKKGLELCVTNAERKYVPICHCVDCLSPKAFAGQEQDLGQRWGYQFRQRVKYLACCIAPEDNVCMQLYAIFSWTLAHSGKAFV